MKYMIFWTSQFVSGHGHCSIIFNCSIVFLLAICKVVVTADQGVRGGKVIELKRTVDIAVAECNCVENVFVMSRTGAEVPMQSGRDIKLEEVSMKCPIFVHNFEG